MKTNEQPLYETIAELIIARHNCLAKNLPNTEWARKHLDSITELMREFMPSGSGWTDLDLDASTGNKLVFFGSFHHMNSNGYYDGWTNHTITVTPSLAFRINLRIGGTNRNDIKEYLHDLFYNALTTDISDYLERKRIEYKRPAAIAKLYAIERRKGWTASNAYRAANIRFEWSLVECGEHDTPELGSVRLQVVPDDSAWTMDDLKGDTFNPDVNDNISASKLEKEKEEFREKVNAEGVWRIVGEYWDGDTWQHADSCFGFVGDDWKDSGTDLDVMAITLDAAKNARKDGE